MTTPEAKAYADQVVERAAKARMVEDLSRQDYGVNWDKVFDQYREHQLGGGPW